MNIYQKFKYLKSNTKLIISALLLFILFSMFCSCIVLQRDIWKGFFCFVAVISAFINTINIINMEYSFIKRREETDKMFKHIEEMFKTKTPMS